MTLTSVVPICT